MMMITTINNNDVIITIYQKAAYYTGIQIFNNLRLEIQNAAGNPQKFYTLIHFTQWKNTLDNRELSTVSQQLYYSGILI